MQVACGCMRLNLSNEMCVYVCVLVEGEVGGMLGVGGCLDRTTQGIWM